MSTRIDNLAHTKNDDMIFIIRNALTELDDHVKTTEQSNKNRIILTSLETTITQLLKRIEKMETGTHVLVPPQTSMQLIRNTMLAGNGCMQTASPVPGTTANERTSCTPGSDHYCSKLRGFDNSTKVIVSCKNGYNNPNKKLENDTNG